MFTRHQPPNNGSTPVKFINHLHLTILRLICVAGNDIVKSSWFFAIILTVPLSIAIPSYAVEDHQMWYACQNDNECMPTPRSPCSGSGPRSINRNYLQDYKKFMDTYERAAECAPPPLDDPNAVAKCIIGRCDLVHISDEELYKGWRQCQSDDDCGIKRGGCGDVTANKKYLDQVEPSQVCDKSGPHDPNSYAKCFNNQCIVKLPDQPQ